jgi:pimeloyl-ACP methyl ester carboxylesterase
VTTQTTAEARTIHANGIDIHYHEQGEGDALVLLQGGLVSTNLLWTGVPIAYASHMETLAAHFQMIAPDTRGGGRTPHGGGPITFDVLADDVAALIEELELERDEFCPVEMAVAAYRQLPDGELAIMPGHGHYIPPAAIETTIEFLERRAGA